MSHPIRIALARILATLEPRPVHAAVYALALAALPTAVYPQSAPGIAQRIDAIFAEWDRPGSPGCAIGVVHDGKLVYARGYGSANLDYDVPLTPNTVFYLASVSKQFTAAAVALAVRQGHLSLDDDVRAWVPELPDYGDRITVRHLIHHTSGLRDYLTLMRLAGMRYEDVHSEEEILDLIARQQELNFRPGDDFLYSNTGYFLLAVILERATGKTLRQFTTEHFFQPLGMDDTHFHDDAGHVQKNRAYSYVPDPEEGFRIAFLANFDQVGSGGLYSTVEDLVRWDRNFDQPTVGGKKLIGQLHERFALSSRDTLDYAFGLALGEYRGLRTVSHGGSMMGFRTAMLRFPDDHFTVVCLCNLATIDAMAMARRVADVFLADRLAPRIAEGDRQVASAASAEARKARPVADTDALIAFTGTYISQELKATYRLELRDDALVLRDALGATHTLTPVGEDVFDTGPLELHFQRDGHRITGFRLMAGRVRNLAFVREP